MERMFDGDQTSCRACRGPRGPDLRATGVGPEYAEHRPVGASAGVTPTAEGQAFTRFSRDGAAFIEAVRAARRAIFEGDPKTAKDLMHSLKAATKEALSFDLTATVSVQRKGGDPHTTSTVALVPVDGQVVIADDFVRNPLKQSHVDKANEHFKKGEAKQAVEELRLARIGVGFTRQWAPITSSEIHLDDAIDLADADKYYEANLSLKAIEDGITTDSMTLLGFLTK